MSLKKGKWAGFLKSAALPGIFRSPRYVFDFISRFIDAEWDRYNANGKMNRYRKTDFATGILSGFKLKLDKESSVRKTVSTGFSLVPITDPQLKQYFSATISPH